MKKLISVLLLITLVFTLAACGGTSTPTADSSAATTAPESTPASTPAASTFDETVAPDPNSFSLRIEGNYGNLYYGYLPVGDGNLLTLLENFDTGNTKITIEGLSDGYITKINNEATGSFGGWDGWCVLINGESPMVGISDVTVSEGDKVVLYYGDPWGVGMAYPEFEVGGTRILFYTSTQISATGDVTNMKVIIDGHEYNTGELGFITLDEPLAPGEHTMQIERKSANGLCLALRFAPDFTFEVQ